VQALRTTILRTANFLDAKSEQWLVFRCTEAFSPKTRVAVEIDKIPSLEGDLIGSKSSFSFSTVYPLSVTGMISHRLPVAWAVDRLRG
jgi:hypothetical protein